MIGRIKLFEFDCPVVVVDCVAVVDDDVKKSFALAANGGDDNGANELVFGFAINVDN